MAGFKPATPNSPQWAQSGTEKSAPSSQSSAPGSSEPAKDSSSQPQPNKELPELKFLSQRVEDIRGMADPAFNHKGHEGSPGILTTVPAETRQREQSSQDLF
jgi:hypothetical protein